MRTLVPADSLIYLETNDLVAALQPIIDNHAFIKAAKTKPDISALKGIQVAVTVSGFEMTEEKLTDEHSLGRVQPRFVAIVETHAWNWQAVAFAESQIGSFVMDAYRSDVAQEKIEKHGGTWFTWTANDERKAFALVIDSLIYFGNDEPAIEKCLAVKRGEADSIIKTGKIAPAESTTIAAGYVSRDGMAQISSLVSLSMAAKTQGEPEVQSAIAGILPQLLRGTMSEVKWVASTTAARVEDRYSITSPDEIARVLSETLTPTGRTDRTLFDLVPDDILSVTSYDLAKPNVAWRSLLLTSKTLADPVPGSLIGEFGIAFAESYGIRDPELFLSGVGPSIVTGNIDQNSEKPVVIASVVIAPNVRAAIDPELKLDKALSDEFGVEVLRAPDGDLAAAFFDGKVITGDAEAVLACLRSRAADRTMGKSPAKVDLLATGASAASMSVDKEIAPAIASVMFQTEPGVVVSASVYTTETRFTRAGIERRVTSDFGLIGWIIAQLAES